MHTICAVQTSTPQSPITTISDSPSALSPPHLEQYVLLRLLISVPQQHLQAILNAMKSHILMLNKQNVEKMSLKEFNFSISEKSEKGER